MRISKYPKSSSLEKTFLYSLLLLYIIAIGISLIVFYIIAKSITDGYIKKFAVSQSILEKNRIMSIIERDAVLSLKLADDPVIRKWIMDQDNDYYKEYAFEQLESYRKNFRDKTFFLGIKKTLIYYFDDGIGEIQSTSLSSDEPADRWFFQSLESSVDFWINVDYNILINQVKVWINALIRDDKGMIIGVTGTGMDFTQFLSALVDNTDEGISTIIVNTDKHILAHEDRSIIEYNATVQRDEDRIILDSLFMEKEQIDYINSILDDIKNNDMIQVFDAKIYGNNYTIAVSYIPELMWYNLVLVDGGYIIGIRNFIPIIFSILISLMVILISISILMKRQVLNPLQKLNEASNRVALGDYSVLPESKNNNEIGKLSNTFCIMTNKIREYTANLEEMVNERTRELQKSQQHIMKSIRYGHLIQKSIMPARKEIKEYLDDYFLIFRSLETVGGDFAFFKPSDNGFYIAVVDCTGHGIPGAFMTMLVSAQLNRVIDTNPDTDLNIMLLELHSLVEYNLRSSKDLDHVENGMDIALCYYDKFRKILAFVGAGLPLLYTEKNNLHRIEGSRVRLGFKTQKEKLKIKMHELDVSEDSRFYLFSDGILDLPGGSKGFGLGKNGLECIIRKTLEKPMEEQKTFIEKELKNHLGSYIPRDDMIFIGFMPKI